MYGQLRRNLVPTVVAFTKFDQAVALEGGSTSMTSARARVDQSYRSLFPKEPSDVPAEIVSGPSVAHFPCGKIL